jgi:hypothetical protein
MQADHFAHWWWQTTVEWMKLFSRLLPENNLIPEFTVNTLTVMVSNTGDTSMSHFYCYYIFKSEVNFKALFIRGWPKRIDSHNNNSYTPKPRQVFSYVVCLETKNTIAQLCSCSMQWFSVNILAFIGQYKLQSNNLKPYSKEN